MFSRDEIIGLDIGSSCIKAVQLTNTQPGFFLTGVGIENLPPLAIQQEEIVYPDPVVNAIMHLFQKYKIKGKKVALSLAGPSVCVKKITLPVAPADELADMVRWEADQYLPFALEDAYIDFQLLPTVAETRTLDLLLVGAKKARVQKLIQVVQAAGLKPVIIDSGAMALENQYEISHSTSKKNVMALVDIGADIITVNILVDGSSAFVSAALGGGNDLTQAIQEEFNVDYEQAERIKHGKRLIDIELPRLRKVVQQTSALIAAQIEHLFNCFTINNSGKAIDVVVLSGGGSLLRGFANFLARRLNLPVKLANPLKEISWDRKKHSLTEINNMAPLLATGVGLALRRPADKIYRPAINV